MLFKIKYMNKQICRFIYSYIYITYKYTNKYINI